MATPTLLDPVWRGRHLEHINNFRHTIQFTLDHGKQLQLPFLDVLVCKLGVRLTNRVYEYRGSTFQSCKTSTGAGVVFTSDMSQIDGWQLKLSNLS